MSKLRADITWKHRISSNSISTPFNIITNVEDQVNDNENPEDNEENIEILREELDNENADADNLEQEFSNYLQGWTEMLEEETLKFQNEEDEINELDELNETSIDNTIHPAIDPNAKWNLESLFKDLELPF